MIIVENNKIEVKKEYIESVDLTKIPITTNVYNWTLLGIIIYMMLHIFSLMIPTVMILTFFKFAMNSRYFHWRVCYIFIDILAWWGTYLIISLFLGKLLLILLKLVHKPKEGLFQVNKSNRDYYFFSLRIIIKKFIFWIWNNFCFPWVNNFAFKMCDMRADFKSTMFDGWSDVEFIEFGDNIMIGQGAQVFSSILIRINGIDHLLIKKVVIGDHVVLGGNSIVTPGTIVGKGTTLGVWAVTHINQILEPDWIYIGKPARKYQPTQKMIAETKKEAKRRIVDTGERIQFDTFQFVRKENK